MFNKNRRWLWLCGLILIIALAGCTLFKKNNPAPAPAPQTETPHQSQQQNTNQTQPLDNRDMDTNILNKDPEIKVGDLGIEQAIPNYTVQDIHGANIQSGGLKYVYPNPSIKPINGNLANNPIQFGELFLGTPYEYGSDRSNPRTFDCSDFTRFAYLGSLGMDIPKDSRAQARYVAQFSNRKYTNIYNAKVGDLLFFSDYKGPRKSNYGAQTTDLNKISHVGIYMGNNQMLHTASQATGGVRYSKVFGTHYEYRFVIGGSVLETHR